MPTLNVSELMGEIFAAHKPYFYDEFEIWVRGSRRFKAFATNYRVKIRAKLKNVSDQAGMQDFRVELETAVWLLQDDRLTLEYEKFTALKQRGPDYTVTFKTHTAFNVEVRRLRSLELNDSAEARSAKLMAVMCDKVGQMPSSSINLICLFTEQNMLESDLVSAMTTLRSLAEHKREEFFTRRGFKSAGEFLKQYQNLTGVIIRQSSGHIVCLNALARHKAPSELVNALKRLSD